MEEKTEYVGMLDRVKSIFIDLFFMVIFMYITSYLFEYFKVTSTYARIIAFVLIYILYDPLLTTFFGGTFGHYMMGIRVKKESDESKNINFPFAILRYITKSLLGWISLLLISSNEKSRAIHDFVAGSVVIYKT